jgi:hypothetical protein
MLFLQHLNGDFSKFLRYKLESVGISGEKIQDGRNIWVTVKTNFCS